MRLTSELEHRFNAQITLEFEASLVYRQLAIEIDVQNLPGMAAWLRHQADEEVVHANKFIDHLVARGNKARIGSIGAHETVTEMTVLDVFTRALAHEQRVSASIRDLIRACETEGDLDSRPLLNWFLSEQIEEEATVSEIIGRVERVNDDGPGLLRLDEELGARPVRTTEAQER